MSSMKGRRVVITGPTKGIGRVTAVALAKKGAEMILVARDEKRAKELGSEIGGGPRAFNGNLPSAPEGRDVRDQ